MADQPTVNPTPRQEFQANGSYVKLHRDMMQQPMLLVSLHYAQLHYQRLLTAAGLDMNEAANNPPAAKFYKLQGVQEFLDILLKLGEMPAVRPTTQRLDKLNQKV